MSVKERAKAYEDSVVRNSLVGESPPLRKKSREELIGNINDNDLERNLLEERPTPPPRKCKKKGESSPNNASPITERKENIPYTLRQSENAKSRSPVKPTIIIAQKKKRGPPPVPPPRGSSLGRNAECEQIPPKKKERPPVPPKPKNYVPKKTLRAEPMRSNASPSGASPQRFVELENTQTISTSSSKFQHTAGESHFIAAGRDPNQTGSSSKVESVKTRKQDSNGELSAKTLEQGHNFAVKNSNKDGFVEHQGKSPFLEKGTFTSYIGLTEQGFSAAQQTLDPLEGLEVNDIPRQYEAEDSEGESINSIEITDSVNGIMQANQDNLVLKCNDYGESSTLNDSKPNSDIVVAHLEERPAILEHALLEENNYTLNPFSDVLSDGQSMSTFDIVSEEGIAEQCNEGTMNSRVCGACDTGEEMDKVSVGNRSDVLPVGEIRSTISNDLDVENVGKTAGEEVGKKVNPPADEPVHVISYSCEENIADEPTEENAMQTSQHALLPERPFVSGFENGDEGKPKETSHAEGMDIKEHLLLEKFVFTEADNINSCRQNTNGESGEEVVVVTPVEEPVFVSHDKKNTGKEKEFRIFEAEDYQVNLFENKEVVLEDNESTEDHSLDKESTEDPSLDKESTEGPTLDRASTEDPSLDKESTEDPSLYRASTEDPSLDKESSEDTSFALMAEERLELCNAIDAENTEINVSVNKQYGIGNQGQTQDKVNVTVAEPINESAVVSFDDEDDAVRDNQTTEPRTGEEEKQKVHFPDKELEMSASRSRIEELEMNSVEANDLEISVKETVDHDDNVIVRTRGQESDMGIVEEDKELIEQNKPRELTDMGNLIKVEYTNHIREDVVEEQSVVKNVGTVACSNFEEMTQEESINNVIVASLQQSNQEEVVAEVNNLNGFNDTAVICSGEKNMMEENDVLVADSSGSVPQGDENPDLAAGKGEPEPGSPSSPQPIRPERPNRQAVIQKELYEDDAQVQGQQDIDMEKDIQVAFSDRRPTPSSYESVVLFPVPCPMAPPSGDDAIYKVPFSAVPVDSDSVNEYDYSVHPRTCSNDAQYAVPKPIFVQANEVTENVKKDLEVYAVPGSATQVPVIETSVELPVHEGSDYAVPRENDNTYMVPAQQNSVVTTAAVAVPPSKPPRTSPSENTSIQSTELTKPAVEPHIVGVKSAEFPRPLPRNRISNGTGSPEVVTRKLSPSPGPRKNSKTSQNDSENSEKVVNKKSGSPVPLPRSRLNALESDTRESSLSNEETEAIVESKETETSSSKRRAPPPRPPPPLSRISLVSNNGGDVSPMSPGFMDNLDSDSDSDVGEEAVSKGTSKPKTYHIAHEILSTEQTFVDALKLVFEECYGTIKASSVIAESVLSDIFRDLENIYLLDSRFLQELEERMKTWEEHERIGDIIKKYGHFLKMYTTFVNGYDKAMSVFQETMKENVEFANLVSEFQASERCHGMQLSAYMLKPVQRIPSYRLLLIDYLKHLPKDSDESKDTEAALKIVSEVATHINESMKKMDSFEQLLKLQTMLVGQPEIIKAGRDYLKEGTLMKLCRKDMQERRFFLLTDVLLYTTPVGVNQYKLNKMLPLLGMQVTVPDSPDFVNEFSIISTTRSFTLTASTPEERDEWVEDLNKAIDVVTKRKITFASKANAFALSEQNEDMKLGEKAPVWIPDARVTMCMSCTSPFTLTNRRHHCRACGKVVCGACSDCTAPLAYLDFEQTRVCDKCYDLLLKEFHTDEIHIDIEANPLPPLLQESENAEKRLRKPTKFEMTRRFKSRKTKKRKSHIMHHPSHLTEVVGNEEGSQMSGYLRCKKGRTGWKKSWFVLKDKVLYAYKASSDVVALESTPVLGYRVEDRGRDEDDFLFNLKHQGITPLAFKADNETSATRWIQELKKAVKLEDAASNQ